MIKKNKKRPIHSEITGFPVVGGELTIGGIKISEFAKKTGGNAFYAYDSSLIKSRISDLRKYLPNEIKLHYALKANPMPDLISYVRHLVDGFDVASVGELELAIECGQDPSEISFAGPGKGDNELRATIEVGAIINIESAGELERIIKISKELGRKAKVAIRVNPDFELKSSGMKMGGGASPFGIDAEQVPEILSTINKTNLIFMGFHIFNGSQNLREEALLEAATKTFDLAVKLAELSDVPLRTLNIGGGFGIPYFAGDKALNLKSLGEKLTPLVQGFKKRFPKTDVIMEFGRYITAEAGIYVCKVIDRKISRGQTYIVTNGGMHHHLAASGNFGQILKKNYPIIVGNKMSKQNLCSDNLENVNIVGCLCTPLDRLGEKINLPYIEVGDYIVVFYSGAYGFSSSPHKFLNHPKIKEFLL